MVKFTVCRVNILGIYQFHVPISLMIYHIYLIFVKEIRISALQIDNKKIFKNFNSFDKRINI